MGYHGITSKTVWNEEIFYSGRRIVAKANINGNNLTLHFPLDVASVEERFGLVDDSRLAKYSSTPAKKIVKGSRGLLHAKQLIDKVMSQRNITFEAQKTNNILMSIYQTSSLWKRALQRYREAQKNFRRLSKTNKISITR